MTRSGLTIALVALSLGTACTVEDKGKPGKGSGGEAGSDAGTGGGGAGGTGGSSGGGNAGMSATGGATVDAGPDGGSGDCSGATQAGKCDATKVVFCQNGKSATVDCATIGQTCAVTKGRADCTGSGRDASCGSLTAKGECVGAVIKYCDSSGIAAVPREIDCAAYGQKCDPSAAKDGGALCVPQGPCPSGLDENGACDANNLSFCELDDNNVNQEYTFDCGVDMCQTAGGFSDCFVVGAKDGCGMETAAGRCDTDGTRVSCLGGVVAREDCAQLGLACQAATGGGSRCLPPKTCTATCPNGTTCTAGRCTATATPSADWTFMVYMLGNNNLSQAAWADLNEMETVGTTKTVNVVAEVKFSEDYSPGIDPQYLGGKVFRMEVGKDSDRENVTSLTGSTTMSNAFNMSDPARVSEFIQYAVETHPAKHYALVMWNHGSGYKEAFVDGDTLLSLKDVVTGIRDSGVHLDVLGFDACLMGMHEVAYAMRGVADVMVASEEVEPGAGYPYDTVLAGLVAKPTMTAAELGPLIVDKYVASYKGDSYRQQDVTNAAFDLSKIEAANEQLSSVAADLKSDSATNRSFLRSQLDADTVLRFTQKEDADMITVMQTLKDANLGAASAKSTGDLATYLQNPANLVLNTGAIGDVMAAKGLAVFVPQISTGDSQSTLEGYKSRVSFLPMQPWISFMSSLTDDSAPPPMPAAGAVGSFSVILDWASTIDGKTSKDDLDLYVFEPDGNFGTPSNGSVSGSGLLSADSYDSGVPEESYTLAPTHQVGTYVVLAHFYSGSGSEVAYPTLQVIRPDLPGGSRTLVRAKLMDRDLVQVPMDNSKPLTKPIDSTNFQGVLDLDYSNLWYATTIEVK